METTPTFPSTPMAAASSAPRMDRATAAKVQAPEKTDPSAILPANKPFVAQIVSARLSGTAFPESEGEITPPERTLRPYDVPMLPYVDAEGARTADAAQALSHTNPMARDPG